MITNHKTKWREALIKLSKTQDSYTTIKEEKHTSGSVEYSLVVCQKCNTALPVAMISYQYKYCPMCGREITTNA